ncbi:V-type H+ transporting ATPase subunit D family protein [Babesia bovis T2Bo]|uniref:V-type H+ transporting ATPase subunit D family protein n=1 Tax=Babesia bovis T2Bo TaxID=484906 RepID=UPI001C34C862|nr:V-type H+ transporting ATPase subunit D family protein [Babesia bovis T2Bo]EDO08028.2 V-type H+ transporting ATPase subunit D family protein [Babesia bovis T2Bo]
MSSTSSKPLPSRMMLQILKQKRTNAHLGYSLLKRKSDALASKFRKLLKDTIQGKEKVIEGFNEASYALSNAVWSAGDFKSLVVESVGRSAVTLRVRTENVAGVIIPHFELKIDPTVDVIANIGLTTGGHVIHSVKTAHLEFLETLAELASLQVSFMMLEQEIKMTNRRVNALDNLVIPTIDNNLEYIKRELDELEREEFYRLKMVRNMNQDDDIPKRASTDSQDVHETGQSEPQTIFESVDEDIVV